MPSIPLADDLLYGAAKISGFIFGRESDEDRKRVYAFAEKG